MRSRYIVGLAILVLLGLVVSVLRVIRYSPASIDILHPAASETRAPHSHTARATQPDKSHELPTTALTAQVQALRRQVDVLRERVNELATTQKGLEHQVADVAVSPEPVLNTRFGIPLNKAGAILLSPEGLDTQRQQAEDTMTHAIEQLEHRVKDEAVDTRWGAWVESQFTTRLNEIGLSSSPIVNVECGTTLCRVHFQFENEPAQDDVLSLMGEFVPPENEAFLHVEGHSNTVVLYLFRVGEKGHSFMTQ